MRRLLSLAAAAVLLVAGCTSAPRDPGAQTAQTPDWSVPCPEPSGEAVIAADFAGLTLPCLSGDAEVPVGAVDGKPLIITLWASWCRPCVKEMPAFQEFHEAYGDQVAVLGVDTQDTRDAGRYFAQDFGLGFPSVFDERAQVRLSQGLTALPATFFIDNSGETVAVFNEGELTTEELVDTAIEKFGLDK